jgi:hypothetical protein
MTEKLTEHERGWLESDPEFQKWDVRKKVLRIIDAQAARIAELEAELALEKRLSHGRLEGEQEWSARCEEAEDHLERMIGVHTSEDRLAAVAHLDGTPRRGLRRRS